jgi:hypothetical protein
MICSLAVNVADLVLALTACTNQTAIASLCRHSLTSHGLTTAWTGPKPACPALDYPPSDRRGWDPVAMVTGSGSPFVSLVYNHGGRPCRGRIGEIGVDCLLPIICLAE